MEKKIISCPLDCFDLCSIEVDISENNVLSVRGDKTHPLTDGVICKKGINNLKRHNSIDRIKTPLIKVNGIFETCSYEYALEKISTEILKINSKDIVFYTDSGYNGISKSIDEVFFSHIGPITTHRGSLCWSAGINGVKESLNEVRSVSIEEIKSTDTIILWGRNVSNTNIHLAKLLKTFKGNIVYIDPIKTSTSNLSTRYIRLNPNGDVYGILSILKLSNNLNMDDDSKKLVEGLNFEELVKKSGMEIEDINFLLECFENGRVISFIGYGLQRYIRGSQNVTYIIELHKAFNRLIGMGNGISYADKKISSYIKNPYILNRNNETFPKSKFGEYILQNPKKLLFITKANPYVQLPNSNKVKRAFDSFDFKIGIDLFMTDTMKNMDLVLPANSIFEQDDILFTSMFSPYLQYSQKCVDNNQIINEFDIFIELSKILKIKELEGLSQETYLKTLVSEILKHSEVSYEELKEIKRVKIITDYGNTETMNLTGHFEPIEEEIYTTKEYPIRLITPHHLNSLNSQGFKDIDSLPIAYVSKKNLLGEKAKIISSQGSLICELKVDENLDDNLIYIYEGYWEKSGIVNVLTVDYSSNKGDQAAYYDTFVRLESL